MSSAYILSIMVVDFHKKWTIFFFPVQIEKTEINILEKMGKKILFLFKMEEKNYF